MAKVAVIYKGKYGTTEKYANWIAEETGGDVFTEGNVKPKDLVDYDTIVFGGCVHAGGIQGIKFMQKNYEGFVNAGKKVLFFAVGLNIADDFDNQKQCMEINFVKKLKGLPCYFMKGGYDPVKVSGMDKAMMGMVKKIVSGKAESEVTEGDRELISAIENGADFSDKKYITEIVNAING